MGETQAPIEVFSARDTAEAYLVRGILREAGIEAIVVGESLVPPLEVTPRIWVRPDDADRARQLIEDYDHQTGPRVAPTLGVTSEAGAPAAHAEPFCYYCGQ